MPTLTELRTSLTDRQHDILNRLFEYEQQNSRHMPVMRLYDLFGGEEAVESALSKLSDHVLLKYPNNGGRRRYGLNFLGYLLTDRGKEIQDVLVRYLTFVKSKLQEDGELEHITFNDLKDHYTFSDQELELFQDIIFHTPFHNGGSRSGSGIPPNVDKWYSKDLNSYVESTALRDYDSVTSPLGFVDPERIQYFGGGQIAIQTSHGNERENLLEDSLQRFQEDHPNPERVGFVMMRFGKSKIHETIFRVINNTLVSEGLGAVRADDKDYHEDLFYNVLTYMHGCEFGIAVFEHAEGESFNPNVAFEVGYMMALKKPVCLLKDQTLTMLPTDLAGKLYCPFDTQDLDASISKQLSSWLKAKNLSLHHIGLFHLSGSGEESEGRPTDE